MTIQYQRSQEAGVVSLVNHAGGNFFGFTVARAFYTYITAKTLLARAVARRTTTYAKGRKYNRLLALIGFIIVLTLRPTL